MSVGAKKMSEDGGWDARILHRYHQTLSEIRCNTEAGSGQQKDGRRAYLVPGTGGGNSFHSVFSFMYVTDAGNSFTELNEREILYQED